MTSHFSNQFSVEIDPRKLKSARAQRMVQVVGSGDFDGVGFVGCVVDQLECLEAVVLDVSVPLGQKDAVNDIKSCLLYTSPSPRDLSTSRMPSSA